MSCCPGMQQDPLLGLTSPDSGSNLMIGQDFQAHKHRLVGIDCDSHCPLASPHVHGIALPSHVTHRRSVKEPKAVKYVGS